MVFRCIALLLLVAVFCLTGCSEEASRSLDEPGLKPPDEFDGEVVVASSCKYHTYSGIHSIQSDNITENQDCIEYSYDGSSALLLKHINTGLNCCPVIAAEFLMTDSVITIVEIDSTLDGGCRCLCLFDIDYRLEGVSPGMYTVNVSEPLASPDISFVVDLSDSTSGIHCVERNSYPWKQ
jgi:hypothetical protein